MTMKMAILGPGNIARKMATALRGLPQVERYAVASRNMQRAEAFAQEWGFAKAYGSYEDLVNDENVDLIYISTPHPYHCELVKLCLNHNKNVLVEKPFAVNAKQAEEMIALAQQKKVFLAEAIWTRYMPSRKMIDDLLASGVIGTVTSLTANLGYARANVERMRNPALAGGALLDQGVYPINFAKMVFHKDVKAVTSSAVMSPEGIDWINSVTLVFEDDEVAVLHSNMLAYTNRMGAVFGDNGYLEIQNINNCEEIRVYNADHELTAVHSVPEQINGYEYEVLACMRAIQNHQIECEEMPHSESLWVMKLLDSIRADWGMRYPFEE